MTHNLHTVRRLSYFFKAFAFACVQQVRFKVETRVACADSCFYSVFKERVDGAYLSSGLGCQRFFLASSFLDTGGTLIGAILYVPDQRSGAGSDRGQTGAERPGDAFFGERSIFFADVSSIQFGGGRRSVGPGDGPGLAGASLIDPGRAGAGGPGPGAAGRGCAGSAGSAGARGGRKLPEPP